MLFRMNASYIGPLPPSPKFSQQYRTPLSSAGFAFPTIEASVGRAVVPFYPTFSSLGFTIAAERRGRWMRCSFARRPALQPIAACGMIKCNACKWRTKTSQCVVVFQQKKAFQFLCQHNPPPPIVLLNSFIKHPDTLTWMPLCWSSVMGHVTIFKMPERQTSLNAGTFHAELFIFLFVYTCQLMFAHHSLTTTAPRILSNNTSLINLCGE